MIFTTAAWTGSISDGTTTSCSALTAQASRQVPSSCGKITSEPIVSLLTFLPNSATIPEPSNPGTAGTSRLPGYFPSIAIRPAGMNGAAVIPTTTASGPALGQGRDSTRKTSAGFPCAEYTATLIVSLRMNAHPTAGTAASNLQAGARLALVGLAVNVAFAFIKIAAGVFGNAYALIADGIESALDAAGSIVIWGGLRFAARPPDATHPYGHGKAEPLAAVVVALGVLIAAAALAVASVREIFLPHHGPAPFTLFVLIIAVVVKEWLFRSVSRLGRAIDSTAITTDAWHHRADAVISMAAAIGISIALIGGEKWQRADDYSAPFACVIIATTGARLLGPALREILDTAPRGEISERIRGAARSVPGVVGLDKCFVRKMGVSYYVDLHVLVNGSISVHEGHELAHRVKDAIRATNPRIADVLVHVEPANPTTHE